MREVIERFLTEQNSRKALSEATLSAYRTDLSKLFAFLNVSREEQLKNITETSLNSFMLHMEKDGFRPASQRRMLCTIRRFFDYAVTQNLCNNNPSLRIHAPEGQSQSGRILSEEELERLLKAPDICTVRGQRDRAMFELLYATGMHVKELLACKCSQLHTASGFVSVTTGEKNKLFPIGSDTVSIIKQYAEQARTTFLREGSDPDLLFYNKNGEALSRQGFYKILSEYAIKLGYEDISPKCFRNSMIVHMLHHGVSYEGMRAFTGSSRLAAAEAYINRLQTKKGSK